MHEIKIEIGRISSSRIKSGFGAPTCIMVGAIQTIADLRAGASPAPIGKALLFTAKAGNLDSIPGFSSAHPAWNDQLK